MTPHHSDGMNDARQRVTGTLPMLGTMRLDGLVHAAVVRSQVPHATITAVDTEEAKAAPEVIAVLTAADLAREYGQVPLFGDAVPDQPVLAGDVVRYVGDPVAVVVATSRAAAVAGAELVDVDYDELAHVTDASEAMTADAPLIHQGRNDNVLAKWKLRHGDTAGAMAAAEHIFDDVYISPPASHVPLEGHIAVASWEGGELTVWSSTQSPHVVRGTVAACLGVDLRRVSVKTLNVGGAFGAKAVTTIEPLVAAVSRSVGRPVRLELARNEVFQTLSKHAAHVRIRSGVQSDGTIIARSVDIVWNAGAYATNSKTAAGYGLVRAPGPYAVRNVEVTSTTVYTNTVPSGPFRGAMTSQLCWAYESQMDDIAARLGLDPVEVRRRNLLRDGGEYATGEKLHDLHYDEILESISAGLDTVRTPEVEPGHVRGRGLAIMIKSTQTPSRSECRLRSNGDGTFDLFTASVELGQGAHATLRFLAAEALGVEESCVVVHQPDTAVAPFDSLTASSRTTFAMGSAVQDAARQLLATLDETEVPTYPIEVTGRWRSVGGLDTLDENGQGVASTHWHQGGVAAEVDVDLATGKVKVLAAAGACHAGRVLSPGRVRHQNEGGMVFALGPTLFEELIYQDGQPTNPNMSDYTVPSFLDVPVMVSSAIESPGSYELHGVGEMTVPAMAPAVSNAIKAACGIRLRELPLTPERVLKALLQAGKAVDS